MNTRPIHHVDCRTKSFVLAICLSDADVEAVAEWPQGFGCGLHSARVFRRNQVHAACRSDSAIARAVTDLLDVRYAETVLAIRFAGESCVRELVRDALEDMRTEEFAPLLWALATDAREAVHVLGQHVIAESFVAGCRSIGEAHEARRMR